MSPSIRHRRVGFSLIELLVAIVIFEFAAVTLVATLLTTFRLERRLVAGLETDFVRRDSVLVTATSDRCANSPTIGTITLSFPATATRTALNVTVLCGP